MLYELLRLQGIGFVGFTGITGGSGVEGAAFHDVVCRFGVSIFGWCCSEFEFGIRNQKSVVVSARRPSL